MRKLETKRPRGKGAESLPAAGQENSTTGRIVSNKAPRKHSLPKAQLPPSAQPASRGFLASRAKLRSRLPQRKQNTCPAPGGKLNDPLGGELLSHGGFFISLSSPPPPFLFHAYLQIHLPYFFFFLFSSQLASCRLRYTVKKQQQNLDRCAPLNGKRCPPTAFFCGGTLRFRDPLLEASGWYEEAPL